MTLAPDLCPHCSHEMDPHTVKTVCDPPYHGWMECPVDGCSCFTSWSVGPIPELAENKCADPRCNYDMVLEIARRQQA